MSRSTRPAIPRDERPRQEEIDFPLEPTLDAVLGLKALIPEDAFTAETLGTEREGSGVLIHENGLVLTVGYLVCEASRVWLTTSRGEVVSGHLLGYDFETGFGLVQAEAPIEAPPLEFGRAADLRVGESLVMAAHGGPAMALRTVLLARREFAGYWEYLVEDALFLAPPHPLWGGAACLDKRGLLVGIGSLQVRTGTEQRPDSLNMALPVDLLQPVLDDLVTRGRARRPARPWLGLYLLEDEEGLAVLNTVPGGPAARAGVEAGDRIVSVGELPVCDLSDFYHLVWELGPAGTLVPLTVRRGEERLSLEIESADRADYLKRPSLH